MIKPESLLNQDSLIDDEAIVPTSPFVPVKAKPCESDERKRELEIVDEAVEKKPLSRPSVVEVEL